MPERGDIILEGLLRIVAGLLLSALVLFEIGAVVVNQVQVDSNAQVAARAGASAWADSGDRARTDQAIQSAVRRMPGATLTNFQIQENAIEVTVNRQAPVLLVHRLSFVEDHLMASAEARAGFDR